MPSKLTYLLSMMFALFVAGTAFSQPANNNCVNADTIAIANNGWGLGSFVSDTVSFLGANLEFSEYVHPSQVAQDKSVWFRFHLPTTRNVRIILKQPGPPYQMNANDAGWTLFRNGSCLPGAAEVVDPPILNIEGYTHECLRHGDYLMQVTGILLANGPIYVELQVSNSTANETQYDYAGAPYDFGLISGIALTGSMDHYYDLGCQSVFEQERRCPDSLIYTKSTWHTFTTDNVVDHMRFEMREEPWFPGLLGPRNWGFSLYEGNCILDSIPDDGPGLTTVDSCKTLTVTSANQYAACWYACELKPNTTYSLQLLTPTTYSGRIHMRMYEVGGSQTISPDPQSIPPAFRHGSLAFNTFYNVTDYFSCNSVLSNNLCPTVVPDTVWRGNLPYTMNFWHTFEIATDANVDFRSFMQGCQPTPWVRIFQGDVMTDGCNLSLDTTFLSSLYYRCLPAGKYSVQILGQYNPEQAHTCYSNLGKGVNFRIRVDQVAAMSYGLFTPQEIDSINGGAILVPGNTYNGNNDYYDCRTTLMPAGNVCTSQSASPNNRVIYRLIQIGQDGILTVGSGNWWRFRYRLYRGNASTAPIIVNEIQGLVDQAGCQSTYWPFKVCVTAGYYTLATFGDVNDVSYGDSPWFTFDAFPPTQFTDPNFPELLDTLGNANVSVAATPTRFNCDDNPLTILGNAPCNSSTKQVYREFYLDSPQLVTFTNNSSNYYLGGGVTHRIFTGRISNSSLTGLHRNCSGNWTECMQPGWYTVVSYGYGETFSSPNYTTGNGGSIGDLTSFTLTINPNSQQFGTFGTAEQVNGGAPIFWEPDTPGGHTPQNPRNHKTITLGTEYWDCANNLPFPAGITACIASHNRISYRVFTLSKPSHVFIEGLNPWPYNHQSRIYQGDITGLAPPFTVIQECITDDIRQCLAPGTYTLVTFAGDGNIGRTMTPTIYLDSLGTSQFDHANNAYEFGNVPNTSTEYKGNIIDPPGPFGRAASNDFIFCTTTAQASDPRNVCPIGQDPPAPALPSPWNPRQNLWYTFSVTGPGQVDVSVYNLTQGKSNRSPFAVYKANNVGFPPADSTTAQGLTMVARSTTYYCGNRQTVNFYRDPCSGITTDRYYVLVDRIGSGSSSYYQPNTQVEVGIKFSPAPPSLVLYDHYSHANVINDNPTLQCNAPYSNDTLWAGTYTGCIGNLNCATRDVTDQNTCGQRTIWYTFEVLGSGLMRINYDRPGSVTTYNPNDIQLYRAVVQGDSTTSGLVRVPLTSRTLVNPNFNSPTAYLWGEGCMQPGRYYIMFTGCSYPTETVIPRIWLEPQPGDLCTDPIITNIDSAGVYQQTLNVNCLTIGEAPGENGTNMGCLDGPVGYKSAWFHVNLNDTTSKYDIDLQIDEFTTVTGDRIKYRIGYGDCNAMTFDNCVSEGVFIILNLKCRESGSFWVQVTLPNIATDSIQLTLNATPVSDTACLPIDPSRPRANFNYVADCADSPVQFLNSSTSGPGVTYTWDFGDGFGSTVTNPIHQYAQADTFFVSLIVDNGTYRDTLLRPVIVYPRPGTNFSYSPAYPILVGTPVNLTNLTTNTQAGATYYWNFCAGPPPCGTTVPSYVGPNPPAIVYNQPGPKRICLTVTNGNCDSTLCVDFFVSDTTIFAGGPYDGHSTISLTAGCQQTEQNVFTGGPYDGAGFEYYTDSCSSFFPNVFAGGPFDGHDSEYLTDSCSSFLTNVYAGGPFDGADAAFLTDSCPTGMENIYAGGPFDGHDAASLVGGCPLPEPNVYAGGPYDGHSTIMIGDSCSLVEINVFAGGPYDGHDLMEMYCDTIPVTSPDTNSCDSCFYAGGPYDGAAVAVLYGNCAISPALIYAGGPYDGHDEAFLTDSCQVVVIDIYAGGPYDGHDVAYLTDSCGTFNINLYAGGPYDGHDAAYLTDSCSSFTVNLYAGGPYDGHDFAYLSDSCSSFLINVYAGGPYDGHDTQQRVPNDSTPFVVIGDTVCLGFSATFQASAPTNWFTYNGSYNWVGGTTNSFTTPVYYSPGIHNYWVDNPFSCEKLLVQAYVLDTLSNVDFLVNPGCAGDTSFFTNQSIVPGPPQPSINSGGGGAITSLGSVGTPPFATQLTFSSSQYENFNLLANGTNDQHLAWTANNGGASTQWAQWSYLTPKSVNRFYYWPQNTCCANKGPVALRLYYDDGNGWIQVRSWAPTYPSNADFDTGYFFETANIYATRWKLEMDVLVANGPSWGEFQIFASDPTVGGNAIWTFGDGNGSTLQYPQHIYASNGNYNVSLNVDVPGVLCVNNTVQAIVIDNCVILPLNRNLLSGRHLGQEEAIKLSWDIQGEFEIGELLKWKSTGWVSIHTWESQNGQERFTILDTDVIYGSPNLYQVRAQDREGREQFSNRVAIRVERPEGIEVVLFPNPVEAHTANFLFKFPEDAKVEIELFDLLGHRLLRVPELQYVPGIHRLNLNLEDLAASTYLAVIRVNGRAFVKRMVVLGL